MSDEQRDDAVDAALGSETSGHVRLRDLVFTIDEAGRLVIGGERPASLEILIPGRFSRDDIDVYIDGRGVGLRVKRPR